VFVKQLSTVGSLINILTY